MTDLPKPRVAFGPVMRGWGSWEWLGEDLAAALGGAFSVSCFEPWSIPEADAVVFVKHAPPLEVVGRLADVAIIYCPVDAYGAVREIEGDAPFLRRCSRVIVNCERLRPFVVRHAEVAYLDHHIKFFCEPQVHRPGGPVLWTGVRSNLPPVVEWVNRHGPSGELWILTNPEDPASIAAESFGFRSGTVSRLDVWTPERHREWASIAGAAFDVKGEDFRSRHKPSAKAIDFVASGLPFAMNADASAVEHLAEFGLAVPDPKDRGRWRSREYWDATQRTAARLREELTLEKVAARMAAFIGEALRERGHGRSVDSPKESGHRLGGLGSVLRR